MMRLRHALAASAVVILAISGTAAALVAERPRATEEWNFRVLLDGDEIGYHQFRLFDDGAGVRLVTEAEFRVRFLFITAFRYEHANEETWRGECLHTIASRTDANGQEFVVRGARLEDGFVVDTDAERTELGRCVKTFAYWNPGILEADALLNSQTGEMLPVRVRPVATETLVIRGEETPARRYKLTAKDMDLDIWYSPDDHWLALESTVKGGRKLRYELT